MELDIGTAISVISEQTYKTVLLQQSPLQVSNLQLHIYTGANLTVLGQVSVSIQYGDQSLNLPVTVMSGTGPRNWLKHIFKAKLGSVVCCVCAKSSQNSFP